MTILFPMFTLISCNFQSFKMESKPFTDSNTGDCSDIRIHTTKNSNDQKSFVLDTTCERCCHKMRFERNKCVKMRFAAKTLFWIPLGELTVLPRTL